MPDQVQRFDIPTAGRATSFELFKAFREFAKRQVEARGEELDPGWYPEENPDGWSEEQLEAFGLTPKRS
jgi:hypothetical protein